MEKIKKILNKFDKEFDKKWGWNLPDGITTGEFRNLKVLIPSSKEVKEFCKEFIKKIYENKQ